MSSTQNGLKHQEGRAPQDERSTSPAERVAVGDTALAWFAKLVVLATFTLIFIGGLVTSHQAGMAVPDWPLSYGSLNPQGWWNQLPIRLEHGHRLFAMFVGLLVGISCAWVWQSWRALLVAAIVSGTLPQIAAGFGASQSVVMHLRIWPAAIAFLITIFLHARGRRLTHSPVVRALAVGAFVSVCFQATLGGLRVTQETAGALDTALIFRIVHGIFAQTFLCMNVALATMLGSRWQRTTVLPASSSNGRLRKLSWCAFAAVYLQLVFGAAMRHMGAGLAIPTFPEASPSGSWLPPAHNAWVDLNFAHTRVGALLVTVLILVAAVYTLIKARGIGSLTRSAWALIVLVLVQATLGMFVIWHLKPRTLTTFHVVNGAALLAVTLLLALRISKAVRSSRSLQPAISLQP